MHIERRAMYMSVQDLQDLPLRRSPATKLRPSR